MGISRQQINVKIYTQPTLGGRSNFEYAIESGSLLLRFGKMTTFLKIKQELINEVKIRVVDQKYSKITSFYNKPKWQDCPNNRISVYIACLIINNKFNKNE
jgi:hypothetical protein